MNPRIVTQPTTDLLNAMKSLAVIAVAPGVIRSDLMKLCQNRDEPFRSFAAKVRGKAETCGYREKCQNPDCNWELDFTRSMVKDVLVAGIADLDIRREVMSTDGVLQKTVNEIVSLVEAKEMARNALPQSSAAISSFRRQQKTKTPEAISSAVKSQTAACPDCGNTYALYSEGATGWNAKPHRQCIDCYRKSRSKRRNQSSRSDNNGNNAGRNGEVSGMFAQITSISSTESQSVLQTDDVTVDGAVDGSHTLPPESQPEQAQGAIDGLSKQSNIINNRKSVRVTHNIFSKGQWRRARFMDHPKVDLQVSVAARDYKTFGVKCPRVAATVIRAMTDTCAQSCLWSFDECCSAGFTSSDLIPVSIDLEAANKSPITIEGALLLRLSGHSSTGKPYSCATMVYVSKQARGFYMSMEAMMDLGIIPRDFPSIGVVPVLSDDNSPVRMLYLRMFRLWMLHLHVRVLRAPQYRLCLPTCRLSAFQKIMTRWSNGCWSILRRQRSTSALIIHCHTWSVPLLKYT